MVPGMTERAAAAQREQQQALVQRAIDSTGEASVPSRGPVSRRSVIGGLAAVVASAMAPRLVTANTSWKLHRQNAPAAQAADAPTGPFSLPPLTYDYAALEPHIDALTMEIHHDRHHQAYVDNLNKAIADLPELQSLSAVELIQQLDRAPEEVRAAIRNNAGGHVNHTLFWEIMGPESGQPSGPLADAIAAAFGSLDTLAEQISAAGLSRFGSGWAWLVLAPDGNLAVLSTPNQDNPLMDGSGTPLLGIDVWEHAYYLQYQNKRKDYLAAWWNVVNWQAVGERYAAALS